MNQNSIVLRKFLNAEIARDFEAMQACLHEDFVLHIAGADEFIRGRSEFLSTMKKVFNELKDWELGPLRIIGDGDTFAVEFSGSGHFSGEFEGEKYSNVPLKILSVCVFDFEDGLIKKCAEYYDSHEFKQQLLASID